jgi:hypothetical protein
MDQLREWLSAPGTDQMLVLRTLGLAEAQFLVKLRVARVYQGLAGGFMAPEVAAALDAFPVEAP